MKKHILFAAVAVILCSCASSKKSEVDPADFHKVVDGKQVELYTLQKGGLKMQITNFGARVITLFAPDRDGRIDDVIVGYGTLDEFLNNPGERFLGAAVGAVANRIAGGSFTLDGETYTLPQNNNGQTLHGGLKGVDMVVWDVVRCTEDSLFLHYVRPDGQDGFPGNLDINLVYSLNDSNEFSVDFTATTDKATPVNLSQHAFWNLKGCGKGTNLDNILQINADRTTPVDSLLIPSGEIVSLDGSPLDFRTPHTIGERINDDNDQLRNGNGYDHNWIIDRANFKESDPVVIIYEPGCGRKMEVFSDQPAVQFYAGNFFDGTTKDKYGNPIGFREAVVFETQKYPDAIHHPNFPETVLRPGEVYTHHCAYRFSAE